MSKVWIVRDKMFVEVDQLYIGDREIHKLKRKALIKFTC